MDFYPRGSNALVPRAHDGHLPRVAPVPTVVTGAAHRDIVVGRVGGWAGEVPFLPNCRYILIGGGLQSSSVPTKVNWLQTKSDRAS